ncbi:hypothetical protein DL93DRAFT_1667850 [Clavulina sp. PMI_390]|nr:hypothetical protein DL93DRAFT_1667850 [Clavulina sp. PMI_390]
MLRNTPESQQIQSNALTYEKLRSLNAFFHSLDRPSKDGFSKVSTQLETLSPESHGLGFCDRRLFELEKVGSFFQAAQNWLHEEKYLVEVMRKQTQNHLRPVSRLPNEVLSEIFLLSMDPDSKSVWDEPFLSTCSRWRKCAVATPAVWRWLYIHENTHPSELIVVLARSHNAPLDVTIEFPSIDDDGPVPELKISHFSLLERLLSHSVWRIVSLTTVDAPMLGWMPISILRTNSLRKLHYDFSYYQEPESLIPTAGSPLSEINFGRLQLLKLTGGVLHSPGGSLSNAHNSRQLSGKPTQMEI